MSNNCFDCTKTTDFHCEARRMCKMYNGGDEPCYGEKVEEWCPLNSFYDADEGCSLGMFPNLNKKEFLKIMAVVQQWSDTHPAPATDLIREEKMLASNYLNSSDCMSNSNEISW